MDIPTQPVDAAVEIQQWEQLPCQVLVRLLNYVEEQVKCIES